LKINPQPGAKIVFLHDPLPLPATLFLAQLRFQDPSLNVLLTEGPPTEQQLSAMDYIFDYQDGQFIPIKPAVNRCAGIHWKHGKTGDLRRCELDLEAL
jgi:hypothetical protein